MLNWRMSFRKQHPNRWNRQGNHHSDSARFRWCHACNGKGNAGGQAYSGSQNGAQSCGPLREETPNEGTEKHRSNGAPRYRKDGHNRGWFQIGQNHRDQDKKTTHDTHHSRELIIRNISMYEAGIYILCHGRT